MRVGCFLTGVSDQTWRRCSWAALSCCRFVPSCCSDAVWDDETLQLKLDVSRDLKMMFYILTCLVLSAARCLSCCVHIYIYINICRSCEFLLGWALYRIALQRRLPISAWGNLSVDSVFLIIPAVLHPIALAVTYRNEWQRAAHSRAVLWVHYKSRFSLEVQPRKLSARSDFHSQEKLFFHSRVDLNPFCPTPTDFTDPLSVQQRKRSPRDVLKCCIHYGCVQCTVQPLWHQLH